MTKPNSQRVLPGSPPDDISNDPLAYYRNLCPGKALRIEHSTVALRDVIARKDALYYDRRS